MSAELCWSIVKRNSCFLVKSQGLTLTKEPNNLTARNSFKYNGYVNRKTVGVNAAPSGKGVVLSVRKTKGANKPGKAISKTNLKGSRHAMKAIKQTLEANSYRKDLAEVAARRTCAIIRSQNTTLVKKNRTRRMKN